MFLLLLEWESVIIYLDLNYMEEIKQALDKAKSYLIFKESKAGKNFISVLEEDVENLTNKVCVMFGDASHIQLISEISKLAEKRKILADFDKAGDDVEILTQELEDLETNQ